MNLALGRFSDYALTVKLKRKLKNFIANFISKVMRYRVSNRRLFLGSILAFVGSFIILMDKIPYIRNQVDEFNPFKNVRLAMGKLNSLSNRPKYTGSTGTLIETDIGFDELVKILKLNCLNIIDEKIVSVRQIKQIDLGGIGPTNIIQVKSESGVTINLTTEFFFREWIAKSRERIFLKYGLIFVIIGFMLGIIGRIEKKQLNSIEKSQLTMKSIDAANEITEKQNDQQTTENTVIDN